MAKYFTFATGLRGCYMPDNCCEIMVKTRKALKAVIADEAYYIKDAGFVGMNKKDIAAFAAHLWREAKKKNPSYLPDVLPYGTRDNKHSAIQISVSNRHDYLQYCKEND